MTREALLSGCVSSLRANGFAAVTFLDTNTCFDIVAKRGPLVLVVKVYENIDSIRREQGKELRKISGLLGAPCVIVGGRTKVFGLEDNTAYYRYGIPVVTIGTFGKLLENDGPEVSSFKGRSTVDMDSEALKKRRMELELSAQELAEKVGVASETIYRFEKGASASPGIAERLERELGGGLVRKVRVIDRLPESAGFDEVPDEKLLERLRDLGMRMALFEHAPFDAFGETGKGLLISAAKGKFDIPRKALGLRKAAEVVDSDSIIVTREYGHKSVSGVPVIEESDLDTIGRIKELRKLIREREE